MRKLIAAGWALLVAPGSLAAQTAIPALPDSSGWGVHVLAAARDSSGGLWIGTYGLGIFHLPRDAARWEQIRSDTTGKSISWDFVHALAFGPRGQIWYGTVGNGWGVSTDSGRSWRNWELKQLGPEWQYVAPDGIVTRGDTTLIATADGLQITTDDGAHWIAVGDATGPAARGPADTAEALLDNEYALAAGGAESGWWVRTLRGTQWLAHREGRGWIRGEGPRMAAAAREVAVPGTDLVGTHCGLQRRGAVHPCLPEDAPAASAPAAPRTTWFRRPIDAADNDQIDQTYRYGSTMGGNFQQHQGVEFNNPDGTPVHAIGSGRVVYAGPAEQGALTVAIRHDTTVAQEGRRLRIFSVYYHNSALGVQVGQQVRAGQVIARVGNTGRATNDHLHLEVHASPTDSVGAIVDSLQRFPPYSTNPELWIQPLPGTGIVAGQVLDADGHPVPQARVYGITKRLPLETPFSYAETYGSHNHPHPLYGEHFAVGDVPPGTYTLGVEVAGKRIFRRVRVAPGKVTWVVFR